MSLSNCLKVHKQLALKFKNTYSKKGLGSMKGMGINFTSCHPNLEKRAGEDKLLKIFDHVINRLGDPLLDSGSASSISSSVLILDSLKSTN